MKNPHFPCKDRNCDNPNEDLDTSTLKCDLKLRYPTPTKAEHVPHYAPNHPWYEPGKY